MKKIFSILFAAALSLTFFSCDEWEPVGNDYDDPQPYEILSDEDAMSRFGVSKLSTVAEVAALYQGQAVRVDAPMVLKGTVSSSDQSGNIYKSLYIQDETGGIELKIGKNGLYNEYKPGQTIYVKMTGLMVGMYGYKSGNYGGNGMVQIGLEDPTGEYETAYFEVDYAIKRHIFRGKIGPAVKPVVLKENQLPTKNATLATCPYIGKVVTIKGLKYANETFTLLYIDSNKEHSNSSNRVFLSDQQWGITTWAMSKNKYLEYLDSGVWDSCKVGNANDYSYGTVADHRDELRANATAYSVSQYFKMGGTEIQVRSSGYSKFGDKELPADILSGTRTLTATGILTLYQGSIQFLFIDASGIGVE